MYCKNANGIYKKLKRKICIIHYQMQTFHKENGSELNEKLNIYCIGIDSRIYYCNNRYTCVYRYIYIYI